MPTIASPLADRLARLAREGEFVQKLESGRVRCVARGHRCLIPPGHDGPQVLALVQHVDSGKRRPAHAVAR